MTGQRWLIVAAVIGLGVLLFGPQGLIALFVIAGVLWVLPCWIIHRMAVERGRDRMWVLWPLLLGWLGFIIAFALLVNQPRQTPR